MGISRSVLSIFIVIMLICSIPSSLYCAPSIVSSSVSNGNIQISGSGFGVKPTPQPLFYSDFDSCIDGSTVDTATNYFINKTGAVNKTTVSTENQRTGSQKNLKSATTNLDNPQFFKNNVGFSSTKKIYFSFWIRTHYPEWDSGIQYEATQLKVARTDAYILENGAETYPSTPLYLWTAADYSYHWHTINNLYSIGNGGSDHAFPNDSFLNDTWQNYVLIIYQGTKGVADGAYYAYISKQNSPYVVCSNSGANKMIIDSNGDYLNSVKFDTYLDANNDTLTAQGKTLSTTIYYDNIYIDNSWARVEIGDSAVYSNCTHREIQYALTWSDTGITGTFNIGSFSPTATVYFFVVDENGIPSDGYPVDLSETPTYDTPTITAPEDFSTTESSVEIEGTYTTDPALAVSTVTWTLGENSGLCVAALGVFSCTVPGLALGANSVVFEIVDSNSGSDTDTVVFTRQALPKKAEFHGYGSIKNATIHGGQ